MDFMKKVCVSLLWKSELGCTNLSRLLRKRRVKMASWQLIHLAQRNTDLNGRHSNQRAFVVGTGPSLSNLDLSLLKGEITFGLNSLFRHSCIEQWSPTYYCINDPSWWLSDGVPGKMNEYLSEVVSSVPGSTFLVSTEAKESVSAGQLPQDKTRFVHFSGAADDGLFDWPRLDSALPGSKNIAQTALLEALAMGCNPIYLIGCDHSFETLDGNWGHFHENAPKERNDREADVESFHEFIYLLMKGYRHVRNLASSRDVQIFNATGAGRLDVFPKADFESLFK